MRLVPPPQPPIWPGQTPRRRATAVNSRRAPASLGCRRRAAGSGRAARRLWPSRSRATSPARRRRADAGQQLEDAKAGDAVARVLRPAQDGEHVLDVGGLEEPQAAELDERDVAPAELDLELAAVWEVRNSTACSRSAMPASRFEDALDHVARPAPPRRAPSPAAAAARGATRTGSW